MKHKKSWFLLLSVFLVVGSPPISVGSLLFALVFDREDNKKKRRKQAYV
jgi:hypothetical protein